MTKMLFISWIAYSRRSSLIAGELGMKLYLVHSLKRRSFLAPLRYLLQSIKTLLILIRERPKIVFVQTPPIFAVLVVYFYSVFTSATYIIDAHTTALLAPVWRWSMPLQAFLSRRAASTIVTNQHLEAMINDWQANAFILVDIPIVFPRGKPFPLSGKFNVAVINTFAPDEPLEELLQAAIALPDVRFYITGDPIRARKAFLQHHPHNISFTGFLPDEEYLGLLQSVQAIVVLTTRDHTMQRGACEALWLGKPIITSDWPILRTYFNKGTIYVDNSSHGIAEGVRQMQDKLATLEKEVLILQQEHRLEWDNKYLSLLRLIGTEIESTSKAVLRPAEGEEVG